MLLIPALKKRLYIDFISIEMRGPKVRVPTPLRPQFKYVISITHVLPTFIRTKKPEQDRRLNRLNYVNINSDVASLA